MTNSDPNQTIETMATELVATELNALVLNNGFNEAAWVKAEEVTFRSFFRDLCEENLCGHYDRNWRCPPQVGPLEDLMANLKSKSQALVFNHISPVDGPGDMIGMENWGKVFSRLVGKLTEKVHLLVPSATVLGAGPCAICSECALLTHEPCRFPATAVTSLEASGIDVGRLAKLSGLKYSSGPLTVTYFGAIFY
ncbi:MAG: DUF2284 domain-containing protein [Deltaproteobacteria bacterium]|jgi:predicted metal-binding protein|nr:DUF2284 domain-containing protein [Deltaproteobacteria bacterium]